MAEFIFKDTVRKAGLEKRYEIHSAATSTEELGNGLYPHAARCLDAHGIPYSAHRATQLKKSDYSEFDFIIGMDGENMQNMLRLFGKDPDDKIRSLLSFAGSSRFVADPWYTRDFETAYNDIVEGCEALLNATKNGLR